MMGWSPLGDRSGGGDPKALKRLSVQFRGMGAPETEIVVSGTVKSVEGDSPSLTRSPPGRERDDRNAEAEIRL